MWKARFIWCVRISFPFLMFIFFSFEMYFSSSSMD
jgi:hypothetical protein